MQWEVFAQEMPCSAPEPGLPWWTRDQWVPSRVSKMTTSGPPSMGPLVPTAKQLCAAGHEIGSDPKSPRRLIGDPRSGSRFFQVEPPLVVNSTSAPSVLLGRWVLLPMMHADAL